MWQNNLLVSKIIHNFASEQGITYKFTIPMEIIAIFPPHIYSVKYDDKDSNEYDRLFDEWNDLTSVLDFLMQHKEMLKATVWEKVSEPELAAKQVLEEAEALELLFEELSSHTANGEEPDFDSHFHYLDGKYKFEMEYAPMKSYGDCRPSLLRMYAIKLDRNTYLITGGGIKLGATIQESPDLQDHVIQNIDVVRTWLKENGIMDADDLQND